ncbi:chord-domain-containing protein [Neoconidiobolus thromboides FSU 785]|nr:chord-domain-containing protein [Neoconidiobolus thromboides FSU 785]
MVICTRRGCGKEIKEDNEKESCVYHTGKPVFHEGLKGWSCCNKRETDFDMFLKIPGCSVGSHSTEVDLESKEYYVKPVEQKEEVSSPNVAFDLKQVSEALPQVNIISKEERKEKAKELEAIEINKEDDTDKEVKAGTLCKRRGCGHKFVDNKVSRGEEEDSNCYFHPGLPIFHEGSKGYSCCKRKVLEFDEFLKIKGCVQRKHVFIEKINPLENKSDELLKSDCRFDWYQSPSQVILSIFAKKTDKEESAIVFNKDKLTVKIKFQDNKLFEKEFELFQSIQPENCSYGVLSTKVEVILAKDNNMSWACLEKTDNISTWTTFGSNDSPLNK